MRIYIIQDKNREAITACFTTVKALELCNELGSETNPTSYREIEFFTEGYQIAAVLSGPIPAELLKGW
jgi:hypothetical protein